MDFRHNLEFNVFLKQFLRNLAPHYTPGMQGFARWGHICWGGILGNKLNTLWKHINNPSQTKNNDSFDDHRHIGPPLKVVWKLGILYDPPSLVGSKYQVCFLAKEAWTVVQRNRSCQCLPSLVGFSFETRTNKDFFLLQRRRWCLWLCS